MLEHFETKNFLSIRQPTRQRQHSLTLSQYSSSQSAIHSHKLKSYQTPMNKSSSHLSILKHVNSKSIARSCSNSRCSSTKHQNNNNFKAIKTSQKYLKQLLERSFNKSLNLINAGEILTQHNIIDVFSYLGLFRDPPTLEDINSSKNIIKVLDRQSKGVKRQNLLKLVYIITKIPIYTEKTEATDNPSSGLRRDTEQQLSKSNRDIEIGWFNSNGIWITSLEDQKIVTDIFGHLYYNKISNQNVKYIKNPDIEKPTFKPKILQVSSNLSQKYRNRLVSNADEKSTEDLLMMYGQMSKSKLESNKKLIINKQLEKCTFKPELNYKFNKSLQTKHVLVGKNMHSNINRSNNSLTSTQLKEQKEFKQCSFKPKIILHKQNHHDKPIVKNEHKIINRMKQAYNKRVISNTIKERGYPKQCSWTQYIHSSKNNTKKDKRPILSVDIKLSNQVEQLHIFQGESFQSIVCKILVKNKIPYEYQKDVESLLRQVLQDSHSVHITDGFIYAR